MPLESIHALLAHYEHRIAEQESPTDDLALQDWRDRIDVLDRVILALMNERVRCANKIGSIKKKLGLPIYVPSREEEVLQHVLEANSGPLTDLAVVRLFERIIDETRSIERQAFQNR